MAEIDVKKFQDTINAIGKESIISMARAGPEMQAKLLKGLGLKGFMVTYGNNPVNLISAASGMVGGKEMMMASQAK